MPKLITTLLLAGLLSACATTAETTATDGQESDDSSQRMVRRCETVSDMGSNRPRRICEMVPAGS
ncbi:hypothetical protein [Maricaulis sp.]|uniref:hypothetical protein n=1 Tax=Maricaulis sp. TaxID=1486257 RepID=UPI003A907B08